jgi:2-dehydro-3-deoxyphosphogluconate aldolase/(4S)-4-hydroxy-2-oxoglutarate aldolase
VSEVLGRVAEIGVVPVIAIDRAADVPRLGEALLAGGLPVAEITFRTDAAEAAIRTLVSSHPEVLVGAGTVVEVDQAKAAVDAGCRFVVSPGLDEGVVGWCLGNDVPVVPGVMTPTEVLSARRAGLGLLKFFPAEIAGGLGALRSLGGVFPDIRFVPTGGVDAGTLADYLRLSNVAACGGTWIAPRDLLVAGAFTEIGRRAAAAVGIVRTVRSAS